MPLGSSSDTPVMKPGPRIFPAFLSGFFSLAISTAVPAVAAEGAEWGFAFLGRVVIGHSSNGDRRCERSRFDACVRPSREAARRRFGQPAAYRGRDCTPRVFGTQWLSIFRGRLHSSWSCSLGSRSKSRGLESIEAHLSAHT